MINAESMILHGTSMTLHTLPHVVKSRSRLSAAVCKWYLSQRDGLFPVRWPLLVQGKACSLPPSPGEGLGAPADTLPDHQAEPQNIVLHMTYHKGSWPDLSMICMSVFFFFFLGFCSYWWKPIRGCFPITLYCTVVPAVWASPLESSGEAPWFSGLGVQTQCSLSLSLTLSLTIFLLNTKLLEREVCVLLWWRAAPPKKHM